MTTTEHTTAWVGADLPRKEDPALVRGSVTYVDDITRPGMLHAAVLRSPHAHARIVSIDTAAARRLPGVHAVLTGPESLEHIGPLVRFCAEEVVEHAIAVDKVRYHGEAVVAVAAESRYLAEDALALVEVEWEPLPVVTTAAEAMADGAPLVHDNLGSNVAYQHTFTFGNVAGDFAAADHVVRRELRWPRATAAPMETNGAVVRFDPATNRMDVWSNTNLLGRIRSKPSSGSFEVACRSSASRISSGVIPEPSSATSMSSSPPATSLIRIVADPASRAFSTSSLRALAGRSTTSPAAMRFTSSEGSLLIDMLSIPSRLPAGQRSADFGEKFSSHSMGCN